MGWWTIKDVKSGAPDTPIGTPAFVIGDKVADVMGDALDKINAVYEDEIGRSPQKDEIMALFNFVSRARGYKNLPAE